MRAQIATIGLNTGASLPIVYDTFHAPFNVGLFAVVTGGVNYTVQVTGDDITNLGAAACTWFSTGNANMVAASSNQNGSLTTPFTAARLLINSLSTAGVGSVTLTSIQAGSAGGPT